MNKLIIILLVSTLSGCSVFCPKPKTVYINNTTQVIPNVPSEALREEEFPNSRIWDAESLQGEDAGEYILELNKALGRANGKIKQTRIFLDKAKEKAEKHNGDNSKLPSS